MYFCVFFLLERMINQGMCFVICTVEEWTEKNTKANKTHDLNKKDRNNNKKDIKWQKKISMLDEWKGKKHKNTLNTYNK